MLRRSLCHLAQPSLTRAQHTQRFLFHDAAVLLVLAGRLDLDDGTDRLSVDAPASLLLVEADTCADLQKTPGGPEQRFRSIFLSLPATLLNAFHRAHPSSPPDKGHASCRQVVLDHDIESALRHVIESVEALRVSDERLHYRLMDFLLALAERGHVFRRVEHSGTAGRLRTLIGEAPDRHWTAQEAGRVLAMSEATLRRRLAGERVRFEALLIDTRMHHAMMLLQTTSWDIPHIALACGYQSRARFSERFRARFGYLPSAVR